MTSQSDTKGAVLERFRVETITEGALRAIARKGGAATMQDIADESGIAKGTLYLYFKDRDELLQRVSEGALSQLIERLEGVFARNLSFDDTVRELVLTKLRFFEERRDLYRVHFELRYPHGPGQTCLPRGNVPPPQKQIYIDRLTRYFEEALDAREEAPRLATFLSEAFAAVLVRRMLETAPPGIEEDAAFLSDLLLHGLSGRRKKS